MTLNIYDTVMNTADISFAVKNDTHIETHFRNGAITRIFPPSRQKTESAADFHKRMDKELNGIIAKITESMETDDRLYMRVGRR